MEDGIQWRAIACLIADIKGDRSFGVGFKTPSPTLLPSQSFPRNQPPRLLD
ncbi:hypothetical protein [Nostoc sp. NOS(2021)]|uniref:hypothetical protein n=1 Tax=Nostoc sp. NOS(2021) TaxID=2815407 RepID=UPI0025FA38EB|nr:hypothetical protein [Nostoc sp. NOS(2021)]